MDNNSVILVITNNEGKEIDRMSVHGPAAIRMARQINANKQSKNRYKLNTNINQNPNHISNNCIIL
jgi:hypothetical protein